MTNVKKVILIMAASSVLLCGGVAAAYCNTSSFGYDDTNMFSYDSDSITIMNKKINVKKIEEKVEKELKNAADSLITI